MSRAAWGLAVAFLAAFLSACSGDGIDPSRPDGGESRSGTATGGDGAAPAPIGAAQPTHQGEGTYYDADGSGNCSFDPSPGDLDVAAMNAPEYDGSALCGACAAVDGPKGHVTVRIVDKCPECKKGDLDLSVQAFDKIADHAAGRVKITWRVVPCAVKGNISYRYKEGSSQYWTGIQVRNHKLPITKLELKKGGAWGVVPRETYNYFVAKDGAGAGPVTVRVTATDGQVVEDTLGVVMDSASVQGSSQFR